MFDPQRDPPIGPIDEPAEIEKLLENRPTFPDTINTAELFHVLSRKPEDVASWIIKEIEAQLDQEGMLEMFRRLRNIVIIPDSEDETAFSPEEIKGKVKDAIRDIVFEQKKVSEQNVFSLCRDTTTQMPINEWITIAKQLGYEIVLYKEYEPCSIIKNFQQKKTTLETRMPHEFVLVRNDGILIHGFTTWGFEDFEYVDSASQYFNWNPNSIDSSIFVMANLNRTSFKIEGFPVYLGNQDVDSGLIIKTGILKGQGTLLSRWLSLPYLVMRNPEEDRLEREANPIKSFYEEITQADEERGIIDKITLDKLKALRGMNETLDDIIGELQF